MSHSMSPFLLYILFLISLFAWRKGKKEKNEIGILGFTVNFKLSLEYCVFNNQKVQNFQKSRIRSSLTAAKHLVFKRDYK